MDKDEMFCECLMIREMEWLLLCSLRLNELCKKVNMETK